MWSLSLGSNPDSTMGSKSLGSKDSGRSIDTEANTIIASDSNSGSLPDFSKQSNSQSPGFWPGKPIPTKRIPIPGAIRPKTIKRRSSSISQSVSPIGSITQDVPNKRIRTKRIISKPPDFNRTGSIISEHINPARVVSRFMRTHRSKITSHFLGQVCAKSGECLLFGAHAGKISKFFNDFIDFKYATSQWTRLKQSSANGIITVIHYEREAYNASSILKMGINPSSDNLLYEFLNGLVINQFAKNYPCFLETYGMFVVGTTTDDIFIDEIPDKLALDQFRTNTSSTDIKDYPLYCAFDRSMDIKKLQNSYDAADIACKYPEHLALLTQYIDGSITLHEFLKSPEFKAKPHIIWSILYQVYYGLAQLRNNFTHYDLHTQNVLLVPLPAGKCMRFTYNARDRNGSIINISFLSTWIVKIIDYGRCYAKSIQTKHNKIVESTTFKYTVMGTSACKVRKNGRASGFLSINNLINRSTDIRLAFNTMVYAAPYLGKDGNHFVSILPTFTQEKYYQIPEQTFTVQHAHDFIMQMVNQHIDQELELLTSIGTLSITGTSPTVWEPAL